MLIWVVQVLELEDASVGSQKLTEQVVCEKTGLHMLGQLGVDGQICITLDGRQSVVLPPVLKILFDLLSKFE